MSPRLRSAALAAATLLLAVLVWMGSWRVLDGAFHDPPVIAAPTVAVGPVLAALVPPEGVTEEGRATSPEGTPVLTWRSATPEPHARALARAVRDAGGQAHPRALGDDGAWEVRAWAGRAPAARVELLPTSVAGGRGDAVALVVTGVGRDDESLADVRALLASPTALTLAVVPFTPFAARLAHDATRLGKEVLVHWPADLAGAEVADVLDAVPFASGLLVDRGSGTALPWTWVRPRHLLLVLDVDPAGSVMREARVRPLPLVTVDGRGPTGWARLGADGGVLTVSPAEARTLDLRGVRPVLVSEVARARLGPGWWRL